MASVQTLKRSGLQKFWKSVVPSGETGSAIYLTWYPASVDLIPAGGASGKVQFSMSAPDEIKAGGGTWHDWQPGDVSAATSSWLQGPVTAVRAVSASGIVTLELVQKQNE